jgi:hypothetical protein
MKLSIEMEAEDWLNLCALHQEVMEIITSNMANDPIAYSSAARITNQVFDQMVAKIPAAEMDRIAAKRKQEREGL